MLKTSVLILLATAAAGWFVFQSSATGRSHPSQPAPIAAVAPAVAVASEPAAANPPLRIIVPAGFDAPAGEFTGTGDHSAGEWMK